MADRRGPGLFVRRALIKSFVLDSQCDTTVNTKKKFQTNMFSAGKKIKITSGFVTDVSRWFLAEVLFFSRRVRLLRRHNTRQQGCFYFIPLSSDA